MVRPVADAGVAVLQSDRFRKLKNFHLLKVTSISEPATLERELDPLMKIRDAYPKILIARTRHDEYDRNGVRVLDIVRWLSTRASVRPVDAPKR